MRELKLERVSEFFWTDSMVTLGYIRNEAKRFHVFVAHRVQEIHDLTDVNSWHYVEANSNPNDDASRGLRVCQLQSDCRWFIGPSFLYTDGPCPAKRV